MLYIILTIIGWIVYKIYKEQKTNTVSGHDTHASVLQMIEDKEANLLNLIKTNHLKDYMQTETALLDCGRKNFIRLNERFKHENIKLAQITKDWIDYLDTLREVVYESLQLDVSTSETSDIHYEARNELYIKIQEIEKRFKELLGDEYVDPKKILVQESE